MPRLFLVVFLLWLIAPAQAQQADAAATRAQLEAAQKDIAELKRLLDEIEREKSGVARQLKDTEKEIGTLEKTVDQLEQKIDQNQSELQNLDEQKTTLEGARLEQQKIVAQQARATYQSGRQEYVKLLLNQQSPEKFSRTLTYYDYLSRARFAQINAFNQTIDQLASVEIRIADTHSKLAQDKASLDQRMGELAQVRQSRRATLVTLEQRYASREEKLEARREEQQALERLLKKIEETLARQAEEARQRQLAEARARQQGGASGPLVSSAVGPFDHAKGRLPWPVTGQMVARFGTPRSGDARATWDGVLIGAPAGTTVRAVHGGRVVFADWLRGAGLLVIVDHGGGYLTLYGHNQSLLRNAGDLVEAGEPLATVGNSGGQEGAALYFAIRRNGLPSDPAQWCRAQG